MARMLFAGLALVSLLLSAHVASAARDEVMTTNGGKIKFNGGSGWINFCPASADSTATNGADSNCVTLRPFGYAEVDASGSTVDSSTSNGKKKKNNLFSALTVSATTPLARMQPNCTLAEPYPCGWTAGNSSLGLQYQQLGLTLDLSSFGSGSIDIYLVIFQEAGTLKFDGHEVAIANGTMKFNVNIKSYKFEAAGNSVEFDMIVKQKGSSVFSTVSNSLGGKSAGGFVNFPRFAIPTYNTTSQQMQFEMRDCAVATWTSGSNTGLRYSFPGNFTNGYYDPIVDDSSSGDSGAAAPAMSFALFVATIVVTLMTVFTI